MQNTIVLQAYQPKTIGPVFNQVIRGVPSGVERLRVEARRLRDGQVTPGPLPPRLAAFRDMIISAIADGTRMFCWTRHTPITEENPFLGPFLQANAFWETPAFRAFLEGFSEQKPPACPYCGQFPLEIGFPYAGLEGAIITTFFWKRPDLEPDPGKAGRFTWIPSRYNGKVCWGYFNSGPVDVRNHTAAWCTGCGVEDPLLFVAWIIMAGELERTMWPYRSRYWYHAIRRINKAHPL